MNFLDFIPEYIFEILGSIAGLAGCGVIAVQITKEMKSKEPSSLSITYVIGWGLIFLFWGLYGIRFNTFALWATNILAVFLQFFLYLVIKRKQ